MQHKKMSQLWQIQLSHLPDILSKSLHLSCTCLLQMSIEFRTSHSICIPAKKWLCILQSIHPDLLQSAVMKHIFVYQGWLTNKTSNIGHKIILMNSTNDHFSRFKGYYLVCCGQFWGVGSLFYCRGRCYSDCYIRPLL